MQLRNFYYDACNFANGAAGRLWPDSAPLPGDFSRDDFSRFMRDEIYRYSANYAKARVVVEGGETLREVAAKQGAILAFLHYGSFFLSGGALVHQLGLPYTAIASNRNLHPAMMSEKDIRFWLYTHRRAWDLYGHRLFLTAESPRAALRWLQGGGLLGVALDVREIGQRYHEYPVTLGERTYFFQDGPERLAKMAGVPILPMSIRYLPERRVHLLRIGDPVLVSQPDGTATQSMFGWLMADPQADSRQMFHSLDVFENRSAV